MTFVQRRSVSGFILYLLLIIVAVIVLFPLWSALTISMLSDAEVALYPPRLWPSGLNLENFRRALEQAPLGRYLLNSVVQSTIVMLGQLITASLAAYAFAFIDFKGRNLVFLVFLSTMMIPWEATIIPNYLTIKSIGWTDTFQGLSAPFLATAFGTFLLRQFMLSIPRSLDEAAEIDGARHWQIFWDVIMPLARPGLIALAIITFLGAYQSFFWPLIMLNDAQFFPMPVGMLALDSSYGRQTELIMAATVMNVVPLIIIFVVFQKFLVKGLQLGGVKG